MRHGRCGIYIVPLLLGVIFAIFCPAIKYTKTIANAEDRNYETAVHFIDVDGGDCTFIELPDGKTMLIDGGNYKNGKSVVKYIKEKGYTRVDYMIATDAKENHIGGLRRVLEKLDVGVVYRPFIASSYYLNEFSDELVELFKTDFSVFMSDSSEEYAKFLMSAYNEESDGKMCEIKICSSKEQILSDDLNNPYYINFYLPGGVNQFSTSRIVSGFTVEATSNTSALIELVTSSHKYLIAGDLSSTVQNNFLDNAETFKKELISNVTVLKVPNHAKKSGYSSDLIKLTKPKFAVVSVSEDESEASPSSTVTSGLENVGSVVMRTDTDGVVVAYERNGVVSCVNEKFETFMERNRWVFYVIICVPIVVVIGFMVFYALKKEYIRERYRTSKNFNKVVDKQKE